jgi:hypothetical protein
MSMRAALLVAMLVACSGKGTSTESGSESGSGSGSGTGSGSGSGSGSGTGTGTGSGDVCAGLIAEYGARIDRASKTCTVDTDCGCYQGGIGPKSGCGGIADSVTTADLDAIHKRYFDAGCDHTHQCGPWVCEPVCNQGTCENRR